MDRPEYLPESHWDATAGGPKFDLIGNDYKELGAFRASKASLPKTAAEYKIQLPSTVKLPEGLTFQPKADDPVHKRFVEMAHKHGASQAMVDDLMALWADMNIEGYNAEVAEDAKAKKEAADQEAAFHTALGDKAKDRLKAGETWLGAADARKAEGYGPAMLGALKSLLKSKDGVEALEAVIAGKGPKMAGLSTGNGTGGPDITKMTARERLSYANAQQAKH